MKRTDQDVVRAVLGPTNTGKTHLAIERLCAHSSGMIGFPLRLLAREVYDRVVAIKGAANVGLITGEEKIMPPNARWLLCTVESMPISRDVAFVALDEAQIGTDPERGHVFTDRLLYARGREETMILGSDSLKPIIRALIPHAEIISRPRFSQLTHAGPMKLSRLPARSAIVAFSVEQVYAVAEMLRRTRGGAAVVMGALSPRTRNAQVAMFQAGEVDYLVATDAIGMGLNMDVSHIAFASLSKFDGKRQRRLAISEIAQIAGRAGRHQRDGTFGVLGGMGDDLTLTEAEIDRVVNHRFPPLDHLLWRNAEPDFSTLDNLIASLEEVPDEPMLRAAPEAVDLAVLRQLAAHHDIRDKAKGARAVSLLWELCGLPDFRKVGPSYHAQLVAQLFLQRVHGPIAEDWFARELARLDQVGGDVDRLASRLAGVRTLAYIAQRPDWLALPGQWAIQTMALEERLSDALHQRLTERFVDRRTMVLMRSVGRDRRLLDVQVATDGQVTVEDEMIGHLNGFRFTVDGDARRGDRKMLLAAAEHHLPRELERRAQALAEAPDDQFSLSLVAGAPITLYWRGQDIIGFKPGKDLLHPQFAPDPTIASLPPTPRKAVMERLERWLHHRIAGQLRPLLRLADMASHEATSPNLRALLAQIVANGGIISRHEVETALHHLDRQERHHLRRIGLEIGALDLFHPMLLKPGAASLRLALHHIRENLPMPPLPMAGLGLLDKPSPALDAAAALAGYRRFGDQMLRIDLVEKIARSVHDARGQSRDYLPDMALATSLGIGTATFARIMRALGFVATGNEAQPQYRWRGRPKQRPIERPTNPAFAALASWHNIDRMARK
ncbi:helicase-related protein [Aquisediminimonas sediminicola]|uniref:helicase-related protein n=1 Tax=Alteraquisediminimonas sediminicola TaxID=2676787 RepID=UPI001C8D0B94|nr:helicase-related protein [Aquisediminimonas sediminicola]